MVKVLVTKREQLKNRVALQFSEVGGSRTWSVMVSDAHDIQVGDILEIRIKKADIIVDSLKR